MGQPGGGEEVARVKTIVDNAERLGLTWGIRPGEITSIDPVMALVDADTEPIGVTPMVGGLYLGQRVYIMRVPPSANYVVGAVVSNAGELGAEVLNTTSAVFSTTSANFVSTTLTAGETMSFTKLVDSTRLALRMHVTGYVSLGAGQMVDIGLLINGDYVVGSLVYNNINQHLQISGVEYIPASAVPAGTYTVIGRVRISGGSTFNMDSGDRVSFEVVELV